jgi:ATP-dependent RNA helicase DHX57
MAPPKKGKAKAAPASASAPTKAPPASKGKKATPKPAEDDSFIVFSNSDKEPKKRGGNAGSASKLPPGEEEIGPPKPTVKQIIGGSSWTGKLPVNLLSEHCQKMKWDRPDYQTRHTPEGYSVFVSLSTKDPKTRETIKLPPFKLPPSHVPLAVKPTALEAKHVAATYALYRVCNMKNLHMMLPPDHKALWKEFEALKKQDVKEGKAWMYEADPFAAMKEREDAKAAAEKKRKDIQAAKEKAASMPGASGLVLRSAPGGGGVGGMMRGWTSVPKIEMGGKTRAHIEDLLRKLTVWNPHGVVMTPQARDAIVKEFRDLGFRQSHIEEAVTECKDREETLEWLLIHVPEDDLPRWAMPENYTAGVSVGAVDLKREGAIKRLAQSGYSIDLCRKVLDANGGDEGRAAEILQRILLTGEAKETDGRDSPAEWETGPSDPDKTADECWDEEMASLEAGFGDHFQRLSPDVCEIKILSVTNGAKTNIDTRIQFRKSPHYPKEIILSVAADLPAYIKLSILKKALAYSAESLEGEDMKIYFLASWIQEEINDVIGKPGALREVSTVASTASEERSKYQPRKKKAPRHPRPLNWTSSPQSKEEFLRRQQAPSYQKMLAARKNLPAWSVQDEIIQTVTEHQVTIISGETGSGKSTQSVQFILDDLYKRALGNSANLIVTQPRRISALGLADRVAEERCSTVGQEVGYSIRGENKTSVKTKITFVTTGVLLRRLQTSGGRIEDVVASLADVSHVVIDEVHERSLDTDFLLSILRDVLRKRKDLKLILMSATLDSATFRDYFTADRSQYLSVGMVEIAGRTFPVTDYYLDDVIHMTGFSISGGRYYQDDDSSKTQDSSNDPINKTIQRLGSRINYDLITDTVKEIDADLSHTQKSGGILIFLPGVAEINRACAALRQVNTLHVLPLHASLETREQRKVFSAPPPGKRKIVVATNVAETSITIDDIVAVIDSGRVKETSYDPVSNMRKLEDTWASRAACKQRRGRAGRVQAGKCYKLYTRNLEQSTMAERPEPEIRRVPLEQLCLSVRAMGIRDVPAFLSRTPTPPAAHAVEGAIRMLQRMAALDGEELTALGQQLAMIPADLRCGKLMVFGAIFGCLDDCVTIAAILSTRSPFLSPPDKRDMAKEAKMSFSHPGGGDLLTDLHAYQTWDRMMAERTPQRTVRSWCDENFLSYNTLSDIASTRSQYYSSLSEIGFDTSSPTSPPSPALLRALTASAFTPQIARIQYPDKKFASSVSGAVELDPEARTIKYFNQENGRVFVHPSSTLFDTQGLREGQAAFLSYFTLMATSKVFIRDLTRKYSPSFSLFRSRYPIGHLGNLDVGHVADHDNSVQRIYAASVLGRN